MSNDSPKSGEDKVEIVPQRQRSVREEPRFIDVRASQAG
jgi:hypothetical protein